jgi:peptidyl-prolyl cis-trans isomerase SurA
MNVSPVLSLLTAAGIAIAGVLATETAMAQPLAGGGTPGTDRVIIDGVAAVVGNDVILMTEVMQRATVLAQQQRADARDPAFQTEVLNSLIDSKLVLTRAKEDSIVVRDEEVTEAVNRRLDQIVAQVGSEKKVEDLYGMPISRIRSEARDVIRQQLLEQRMMQRRFSDLKVSDRDIQEFYAQYRDSLPPVPEQIELQQIVLKARPSSEAKSAAKSLATSIRDSLIAGADFATLARAHSTDAVSAREGGDLGWVAPGRFVAPFERAVKKLEMNEISEPVESEFGFHVIQLLDRKPDGSFHTRHILIPIRSTGSQRDSLSGQLRELKTRALAGESFADLARKYSEDDETAGLGGMLGKVMPDQLPAELKATVTAMKEGEITEPMAFSVSPTETGYRILRVSRRIAPHAVDPVADRAQLEQLAEVYKQQREYANWIAELRKEIYWEIKQ